MTKSVTLTGSHSATLSTSASRRSWLKGLGALVGSGLLAAAPTAAFARPATAAAGLLPSSSLVGGDEYIGIVKLMAGTVVPAGWLACEGQLLPVAEHPALFAVVGTTYGGDGRNTFALPDLRESASPGNGPTAGAPMRAQHCAIKVANAPAAPTALAELRLCHHYRRHRSA